MYDKNALNLVIQDSPIRSHVLLKKTLIVAMHSSFYNLVLYAHEWCAKCKCVSMAVAKRINKKKTMSNFYG
jgi:hypothetical protein